MRKLWVVLTRDYQPEANREQDWKTLLATVSDIEASSCYDAEIGINHCNDVALVLLTNHPSKNMVHGKPAIGRCDKLTNLYTALFCDDLYKAENEFLNKAPF